MDRALELAARAGMAYQSGIQTRGVAPTAAAVAQLATLGGPLPDAPTAPAEVIALLDRVGSPATVASTGGRYFGFVTGGSLPAAQAAGWLAGAWDQNAAYPLMSPVASALEEIATGWVRDLLGLPSEAAAGSVTGATMANFTALAAARDHLLAAQGWDIGADGLFGAPPLRVVVGDEVHVSVLKALRLLGLGTGRLERVPTDDQGRMRADLVPALDDRTIVCSQVGNVNTGASDPCHLLCERAAEGGAWVHVDGAFGLWLAASPETAGQVAGMVRADSWSTDAHKWLNVPYDSGLAFCRHPDALRRAMGAPAASYLEDASERRPEQFVPEMSRRARGVELWAALRSLGRAGVADLVERSCRHARRFAAGFEEAGFRVCNDVVANQVLVGFGPATPDVIAAIQADGTCWCGGTVWHGTPAMRISVSSWRTTDEDVEVSLAAMLRAARQVLP